jgi:hypothetical protein
MKLLSHLLLVGLVGTACKTNDFNGQSTRAAALPPVQTLDLSQVVREVRQVKVTQGRSGSNGNENYSVTQKGVVDIVVVVDNSGSMAEEQANLSNRMAPLLSSIKDSDWRVLVTTTDPEDNKGFLGRCVNTPIMRGDSNPEARFQNLVRGAGTSGTGIERPILAAVDALKCKYGGSTWIRPESTVAVVILTDEDNCHIDVEQGYGCAGSPDKDGSYLTNYLSSIRKLGTDGKVYGIFWHPSQSQGQCSTALKQATIISDVVQKTGGTWGSICDADYASTLSRISQDVAQILKADFTLKSIPDSGTFRMSVNGQNWSDYVLTGPNVHFTRNPPAGAAIAVTYVSGASGVVASSFGMPEEPADGQVSATVNGQAASGVTYDASTRKAVFSSKPADASAIIISYKANTPLKTVFNIAPNADTKFLKVYINGALVNASNYQYNSESGVLTFASPPPEGAKIRAEWRGKKKIS